MEVSDGSRRHDIVVAGGGGVADLCDDRHGDFVHVVLSVDATSVLRDSFDITTSQATA